MDVSKIEKLADEVFQAESNYRALGMMNTYGKTEEENKKANARYFIAETRVIETRHALRAEQGL